MQDPLKRVIDKGLSGRFICLTAIVITYCILMASTVYLVIQKIIEWESFITIFTPFAMIAQEVVRTYFQREDRFKPKTEEPNATETTPVAAQPVQ